MSELWAIYGAHYIFSYTDLLRDPSRGEPIATFDTKEEAEEYIEASRLKR